MVCIIDIPYRIDIPYVIDIPYNRHVQPAGCRLIKNRFSRFLGANSKNDIPDIAYNRHVQPAQCYDIPYIT